jgi:CPA1 family monovalent cation:H+ antiporter
MEHIYPEVAFITMIAIYLFSSFLQKIARIPLPHSIIILAYSIYHFFPELLNIHTSEHFDTIILFLIPVILMYDAMHLKWKYIKEYKYSIAYLAVFSVSLSILIGTSLYLFNIFGAGITIGMYVALFSINMATDAISVGNIFSQFKGVPNNIKVLVEGESLGNDATAMIAFYFIGLPWIINGSFDLALIPMITLKVFGISAVIGLVVGFVGYYLLSLFNSFKEELLIILGVSYVSFALSEYFHVSGIFGLIVGVITVKTLIDKFFEKEKVDSSLSNIELARYVSRTVTTKTSQKDIMNTIDTFSFMAVILVFVSMASMINIQNLLFYWKEILIMFVSTTLIRAIVMLKFVFVGKATKSIDYVGFNGWVILTLAGIKGSLSIIMLHALPKDFAYFELFESVTIGVIILSTFVYGFGLLAYMIYRENKK